MPTYIFTALNEKGHKISGEAEAKDEYALDKQLQAVGLQIIRMREATDAPLSVFHLRLAREEKAIICLQLYHLTRAGIPVVEAMEGVYQSVQSVSARLKVKGMRERLIQGDSLAQAFAYYPEAFGRFFIGMITVGEKIGNLPYAFKTLEQHLRWVIQFRYATAKALRYPLLSIFFTSGLVFLFLAYLLHFALYRNFTLPPEWMRFIPVTDAVLHGWPFIPLLPALAYGLRRLYASHEGFAYTVDGILLKIPYLNDIIYKLNMVYFTQTFAMLFEGGINVVESVRTAAATMSNRVLRDTVLRIEKHIGRGMTLTESVRLTSAFPEKIINAFHIGETTGNMSEAFEYTDAYYRQQVAEAVDSFVAMIHPTLMLLSGALMGAGAFHL